VPEGGELHAWIERTQGVPSSFLNHGSEEMTLSIPGTASSVIAVGAVDASRPIQVGPFSSYGPTRDGQKKPLVCAPGVNVHAAEGGTDDAVFPDSGTSMAAPHVSGLLAAFLSVRREFIGRPDEVKKILLDTCTDIGRDRYHQGRGIPNLMKMLLSV
jgi:subtilisin family serine protease